MITNFILLTVAAFFALGILLPVIKFGFQVIGTLIAIAIGMAFMGGVGYVLFF